MPKEVPHKKWRNCAERELIPPSTDKPVFVQILNGQSTATVSELTRMNDNSNFCYTDNVTIDDSDLNFNSFPDNQSINQINKHKMSKTPEIRT